MNNLRIRLRIAVGIAGVLALTRPCLAGGGPPAASPTWGAGSAVLLGEGLIILNSIPAGFYPRVTGAIELATLPLAIAESDWSRYPTMSGVMCAGYSGIGIYNVLGPQPEGQFKWETIVVNFVAWNVTAGVAALSEAIWGRYTQSKTSDAPTRLQFQYQPGKTVISLCSRF